MHGWHRHQDNAAVLARGGAAPASIRRARRCLFWLVYLPTLATSPPHRLEIQPHTVSPRYAYAVAGRALRVERDCQRHVVVLHLDVQVINRGTTRIDLPIRLRVTWTASRHAPVELNVPVLKPGSSTWLHASLPYQPSNILSKPTHLQLMLTAGGAEWNRLQLPAPSTLVPCSAASHIREDLR